MKSIPMKFVVAGVLLLAIAFSYYFAVQPKGSSEKKVHTVQVNATVEFPK